jgi:hypothetical protein
MLTKTGGDISLADRTEHSDVAQWIIAPY